MRSHSSVAPATKLKMKKFQHVSGSTKPTTYIALFSCIWLVITMAIICYITVQSSKPSSSYSSLYHFEDRIKQFSQNPDKTNIQSNSYLRHQASFPVSIATNNDITRSPSLKRMKAVESLPKDIKTKKEFL